MIKSIKQIIFLFIIASFCNTYPSYGFSMPKTNMFDTFLDAAYEWLFIKDIKNLTKEQQQLINSLHREQDNAFVSLIKEGFNIRGADAEVILQERAVMHEQFQQQLRMPRNDYFHDPRLSGKDYLNFKLFCARLGISPYAIDIHFFEDRGGNLDGRTVLENNKPVIYLKIENNVITSTLLHEVSHIYFGHVIYNKIINRNKRFLSFPFNVKQYLDNFDTDHYVTEHQADLLPLIVADRAVSESISNYEIRRKPHDGYIRNSEAVEAKKLIWYRLFAKEKDKNIEDELLYGARCNEQIAKQLYQPDPETNEIMKNKQKIIIENEQKIIGLKRNIVIPSAVGILSAAVVAWIISRYFF